MLRQNGIVQKMLLSAMDAACLHTHNLTRMTAQLETAREARATRVTRRCFRSASTTCVSIKDSIPRRRAHLKEHISRKELKQDKLKETFQHGADAVLSHTRLASIALLALVIAAAGYFGWKYYTERQTDQAQAVLDDAVKVFNAPIAIPGQPTTAGELTFPDPGQRSQAAQPKFAAVAAQYPRTNPGKLARYYSALCLMDLDRPNQAAEELKKLDAGSDKELAALAQFQTALIAERGGKPDEAIKTLLALSAAGSVLVPKPMVLLELAGIYSQTNPKQATTLYEQLKKDYPNTPIADQAEQGLELLAPNS
jgi:predicted negative regulator of RcsB-dependent stress response